MALFTMKKLIAYTLFVFVHCLPSYAQLSIQIDSMRLLSISDFPREIESAKSGIPIIEDGGIGYGEILSHGPYLILSGQLLNKNKDDCIFNIWYSNQLPHTHTLLSTNYYISYSYHHKNYKSNIQSIGLFNYPWMETNIKDEKIGDSEISIFSVTANTSLPITLYLPILENSKWNKLKKEYSLTKNLLHNIRINKKLEKIAINLLPTIELHTFIGQTEPIMCQKIRIIRTDAQNN